MKNYRMLALASTFVVSISGFLSANAAPLDAEGSPITNVGNGVNDTDAANIGQVNQATADANQHTNAGSVQYQGGDQDAPDYSNVDMKGSNETQIHNVQTGQDNMDAANKGYVDQSATDAGSKLLILQKPILTSRFPVLTSARRAMQTGLRKRPIPTQTIRPPHTTKTLMVLLIIVP